MNLKTKLFLACGFLAAALVVFAGQHFGTDYANILLARGIVLTLIGISLFYVITKYANKAVTGAITELSGGAAQVSSGASQVASSNQILAQGSSEPAASFEGTSASNEKIHSMARKKTENSRSAADLATASEQKFVEINAAKKQTVSATNQINAKSGKLSKIIKTIDGIAFQADPLTLNAMLEARWRRQFRR